MGARSKPNEIRITREYDAPVSLVWEAFTDPQQAALWWGPRGFSLTTHSKELRPGGIWHYTMHGPDGVDYPNKALYHEVEECRRLVYDHGGNDERAPLFRVTVCFSEFDGRTTMDMTMTLPTAEEAAATRRFIREAGGNATWDRLAEYLAQTHSGQNCFVINRTFEVPIERVFDAWVDPQRLVHWLPPTGFDMQILQSDIRPGGQCFFRMSNGSDVSFHAMFEYRDVERPTRIAYLQRFCDEDGAPGRHPLAADFPETLLTSIVFVAEDSGTTRITVTVSLPDATPEEVDAFMHARPGMTMGWTGSFDKLEGMVEGATQTAAAHAAVNE